MVASIGRGIRVSDDGSSLIRCVVQVPVYFDNTKNQGKPGAEVYKPDLSALHNSPTDFDSSPHAINHLGLETPHNFAAAKALVHAHEVIDTV